MKTCCCLKLMCLEASKRNAMKHNKEDAQVMQYPILFNRFKFRSLAISPSNVQASSDMQHDTNEVDNIIWITSNDIVSDMKKPAHRERHSHVVHGEIDEDTKTP